jgi:hypothetical protein
LQVRKQTKEAIALLFGRNFGNPLKLELNEDFMVLASEGFGKMIEDNFLYCLNYKTNEISQVPFTVGEPSKYKSLGFSTEWYNENDFDDLDGYNIKNSYGLYADEELEEERAELEIEILELQGKKKKAETIGDYDESFNLQLEIDELEQELRLIKNEITTKRA